VRSQIGYAAGSRGLHHVSPIGNLLLLAGFLVVGLGPSVLLKASALGVIGLLAVRSDGSPRAFFRTLRFVVVFAIILFVAQVLSIREGYVLFRIGFPITEQGLLAGGDMALRFLVILTSSFLFVTVTDPDRLAHLFIRMGIPYRYGYIPILALRFVPFFRDELRTVRAAQQLRGIRTTVRSLAGIRRAVRFTFVPVLVSGLMRVDSIAMSMKGRCFGLHEKRTAAPADRMTIYDGLAIVGCGILIAASLIARRLTWS